MVFTKVLQVRNQLAVRVFVMRQENQGSIRHGAGFITHRRHFLDDRRVFLLLRQDSRHNGWQ
jgi:hypothetical protein